MNNLFDNRLEVEVKDDKKDTMLCSPYLVNLLLKSRVAFEAFFYSKKERGKKKGMENEATLEFRPSYRWQRK